ncbi:MAG: UDP-N-acetylmuramoyl-tripeptide--D-alanyl-D-alanine ligase [Patescibacteria group bacterium]|nr:UDP-N-acetylmuramoyl-tripeptide--D-alanyl-D-alanine ligase [Patescibacteria group bacterium]
MKKIFSKIILKYLQTLTRLYVKRQDIDIFGLTGSVGKTTLTLALYGILSKKFKIGMTYRDGHGLNSESGIPFAILEVHVSGYSPLDWIKYLFTATLHFFFKKSDYEKFIIEMGVDKPGDMDFILSMTKVDLGIFLTISKTHTENFEKLNKDLLQAVFDEKAKIIKSLDKNSWAVLNYDIELIRGLENITKAKTITFGLSEGADVRGIVKDVSPDLFEGEINFKSQSHRIKIKKFFINKGIFTTMLAAFAVGVTYGIKADDCIDALKNIEMPPGRLSRIEGVKNTIIIDSSYNASKTSMFEAAGVLSLFKDRKKIAVLGDMRELGKESKIEHEEIAVEFSKVADEMVLIGPALKKYFLPKALEKGFMSEKMHCFGNTWKALNFIKEKLIQRGEAILVKGSQNTLFLEIIVERLMKHPSQADKLLCRRGEYWEKKRQYLKTQN